MAGPPAAQPACPASTRWTAAVGDCPPLAAFGEPGDGCCGERAIYRRFATNLRLVTARYTTAAACLCTPA